MIKKSLIVCVFLAGKMFSGRKEKLKLRDFAKIVGIKASDLILMEKLISHEVFHWNFGIDSKYFKLYKS